MKRVFTYGCTLLLALGVFASSLGAQKAAPATDIFSGTVTKLTDHSITVVRKVPGHDAVAREFARDPGTKVEGKLRERARVTVHYRPGEDGGFIAAYVLVR